MRKLIWLLALLLCLAPAIASAQANSGGHLRFGRTRGGQAPDTNGPVTTMTMVSSSGSIQANAPFMIGLPLAAGVLTSHNHIQVTDGATLVPCQEDSRASDLGGNVRFVGLTCLQPSIAAGATKSLTISTAKGAPSVGTDIAVADILATAYDYQVTETDHDGTTNTCSPRTGLAAGTYTNATTAAMMGTWRHGGGLATEYVVYVPLHGQLRCIFHVLAIKAGPGAVSGGNPIIAIRTDRIIESGLVQQAASVTDDWYGLSETSGSTTYSYPNSTPAQTLTVASNTVGGPVAITANSSLWTANSQGQVITDGTGIGVISNYTSGTVAAIHIYKPFAGSTLAGGAYNIWGINHPYGSRYHQQIWWSGGSVPALSAHLGATFDAGALTGGPGPYIASTRMTLNYATPVANMAPYTSVTDLVNQGNNPTTYTETVATGISVDGMSAAIGATGERSEIGVIPDWFTASLFRYDANGATNIFGRANGANLEPVHLRDPSTGLPLAFSNGTDWYYSQNGTHPWGAQWIALPNFNGETTSINPWQMQTAHLGQLAYIPYLLTGDMYWLESAEFQAQFIWSNNNPQFSGPQMSRTVVTADEARGVAWNLRTLAEVATILPDRPSAALGIPKTMAQAYLSNQWAAVNSNVALTTPFPGTIISYVNNTGGSGRYSTVGPRWFATGGNVGLVFSQWQAGYGLFSLYHAKELGALDANGLATLSWLAEGITSAALDTTEVRPEYAVIAYWMDVNYPGSTPLSTWSSIYQADAIDPIYANNRTLNGTATLSATSGTAITVTLPPGNVGAGNWYVGGWFISTIGAGAGQITAVSGDTLTISTSGSSSHDGLTTNGSAFTQTSYAAGQYVIPWPAPTDPIGSDMVAYMGAPSQQATDYYIIQRGANILLAQDGYPGEPAALNAVTAMMGANLGWQPTWEIKWHVAPRL